MLETLRRGRRWGTAAIVILVGGVFVAFIGLGGPLRPSATNAVIQVGERAFHRDDVLRALYNQEQYFREALGDQFDADQAEEFLRQSTAGALVNQAILAGDAERMGFGVSVEEERKAVRRVPGIVDPQTGKVDRDVYERWVADYGGEAAFREALREDLLASKMRRLLWETASVTEAEARDAARFAGEEIRLAYIALDPSGAVDPASLSDDEVDLFADAHPERIQAAYDARRAECEQEEAVRARHILVRAEPGADEGEAEAEAEAIRARLEAGEDFAELATELSDDPGSAARGGDLGFFKRGQMTPAFEEAAFAAAVGDLVGPVRTDFGYHLIRVEERREGGSQGLEEVRLDLARELLAEERSEALVREKAEALRQAVEEGASLESAVRDAGLTLERTAWISRRRDGFVPGLGASFELHDAAFALSPENPSPARIFEVQDDLVLIELLERRAPEGDALAEATARAREELLEARRTEVLQDWVDDRRSTLAEQGQLYVNLDRLDG